MSMVDDIINEVRQNPGLTAIEITLNIFGRRHQYKQIVNQACRRLVDAGRLERRGKGKPGKPFTYHIACKGGDRPPSYSPKTRRG
jgi:hypothetical protein